MGTIARFAAVSPLTPAFTVLDSGIGVRAACAVRKPHAWAPTRVTLTTADDAPVTGTGISISPFGQIGSADRVSTRRCGDSAGMNKPSVDSGADGPVNHPVTSMIRFPPRCEYTLSPSFETGTMLEAARV